MNRALLCVCLAAASFAHHGADGVSFERAQKAVEQGEFKAITSILVAQDGKVVYEHYFDTQGAEGRRNTRSVTKTVTGMLAGVAIADGHIRSASARIFDLLPASRRKHMLNPDRRKDAIGSKTS